MNRSSSPAAVLSPLPRRWSPVRWPSPGPPGDGRGRRPVRRRRRASQADASAEPDLPRPAAASTTSSACLPASPSTTPASPSSTSVADAAAAHLARYGAAFGSTQPGTTLDRGSGPRPPSPVTSSATSRTSAGSRSWAASSSSACVRTASWTRSWPRPAARPRCPGAQVSEAAATATAQASFQQARRVRVPPATVAVDGPLGHRPGPHRCLVVAADPDRVAVRAHAAVPAERRMRPGRRPDRARADEQRPDRRGQEPRRLRQRQRAREPARRGPVPVRRPRRRRSASRAAPAARWPTSNTAYDLGGVVYDNYLAFGGIDLTDLIGRDIGGGHQGARPDRAVLLHRLHLPLRQRVLERLADVLRHRATPGPTTWSATR